MKKIIFVFLFASYLSLSNSLTLNVTKLDSFDQKNFTDRDGALCVNTSIISKGSSFYFIVESDGEGKIDSVIYYKSVDNCPPTNFEFNKEDNSFKKLEQKTEQKDIKYFTYQYEIPKEDDKIWYLVVYTGFEGKKLKASFLPFSALSFIIILLTRFWLNSSASLKNIFSSFFCFVGFNCSISYFYYTSYCWSHNLLLLLPLL